MVLTLREFDSFYSLTSCWNTLYHPSRKYRVTTLRTNSAFLTRHVIKDFSRSKPRHASSSLNLIRLISLFSMAAPSEAHCDNDQALKASVDKPHTDSLSEAADEPQTASEYAKTAPNLQLLFNVQLRTS